MDDEVCSNSSGGRCGCLGSKLFVSRKRSELQSVKRVCVGEYMSVGASQYVARVYACMCVSV